VAELDICAVILKPVLADVVVPFQLLVLSDGPG